MINMKKEMETRNTFYAFKLESYLDYIDVLDKQGSNIFRAEFRQEINSL